MRLLPLALLVACIQLVLSTEDGQGGQPASPRTDVEPPSSQGDADGEARFLVGLLSSPRPAGWVPPEGSRVVTMTSRSGQRFLCAIPDTTKPPEESVVRPEEEREEMVRALKAAYSKGCFTRAKDYWTYEVCPFDKIRQFHKEGERVTTEFLLGSYDPAGDSPLPQSPSAPATATAPTAASDLGLGQELVSAGAGDDNGSPVPPRLSSVYTQKYTGGTGNRESRVRFVCNDDSADPKPLLTGVSEPRPFLYEFDIKTSLACSRSTSRGSQAQASIEGYLKPLAGQCVYLNAGWWTYKFCYGKSISQFHRENRAAPGEPGKPPQQEVVTTQEYDLGRVTPEAVRVVAGDSPKTSYASQWYTGGTRCDIASKAERKTEVRFVCDPNESLAIVSIKETTTCEYQLIAATRLLCQHKQFAADEPRVHEIACSPVLRNTPTAAPAPAPAAGAEMTQEGEAGMGSGEEAGI